jgi:hypothetical protein
MSSDKIEKQCQGCNKFYIDDIGVLQHHKRSPLCKEWTALLDSDESDHANTIQGMYHSDKRLQCLSCKTVYSTMGNLNKHLRNSTVCQKLDTYHVSSGEDRIFTPGNDGKQQYGVDGVEGAPWAGGTMLPSESTSTLGMGGYKCPAKGIPINQGNIVLIDKTQIDNLPKIARENQFGLIIGMLPNKECVRLEGTIRTDFTYTKPKTKHGSGWVSTDSLVNIMYIEYGDIHDTIISDETFVQQGECYQAMKDLPPKPTYTVGMGTPETPRPQATLLFCNNGFQRSIPFIAKFLLDNGTHPTLESALSEILSSIDPLHNPSLIRETATTLFNLKREDGSPIFNK